MKYLECSCYEDDSVHFFNMCIYRYDFNHGFNKQKMQYVPVKYMKRDGTCYISPKPYDWRDYDVRGDV